MTPSLAVVAAVNDETVLQTNLGASPMLSGGRIPLIIERGRLCAGAAYNAGMSRSDSEVIIFTHQDVFLPDGWFNSLVSALEWHRERDPDWGVAGCFGVASNGRHVGHVYSSGLRAILGQPLSQPTEVRTLDEMVLILRRSARLRFDEHLPHFHFYGADICMAAQERGLKCYVIPAFCIHNSNPVIQFPKEFYEAYYHVKARWRKYLPIETTCIKISQMDFELRRNKGKEICRNLLGLRRKTSGGRVQDPGRLLKEIQSATSITSIT